MVQESIHATEVGDADPLSLASTGISGDVGGSVGTVGRVDPLVSVPDRIGRYLVLRKLGAGAMGVVVLGYDPELDRNLALKLIHPRVTRRGEAQARMLREAKGLARLSHPNVVQIYDAGTIDGRVFIAMELVDGEPLAAWRKAAERSFAEILEVYLQAGRGLAAAHDAGLVHRDFKPENVLVDRQGRARVLDFGLVRSAGDSDAKERSGPHLSAGAPALDPLAIAATYESVPLGHEASGDQVRPRTHSASASELDLELTSGGQIMGTPAYMSPEQWKGVKADARSDQFSFCVALWETLYGERPFQGRTVHALAAALSSGTLTEPGSALRLPRRVRKALERGLSVDPARRFASMHALLRELGREDWSGRSLPLAAVALVAFGVLAWGRSEAVEVEVELAPSCAGAGAAVDELWNPERRQALAAAFSLSEVAGADSILTRVTADLDRYAGRWVAAANENCAATRIRQQQSDELFDLRGRCLDAKLTEFGALVEILTRADASTVDQAVLAVESLPRLRSCEAEHVRAIGAMLPKDPALAERVSEARQALASVRASLDTGRFNEASARLVPLDLEVLDLDYLPLTAEHAVERGRLYARVDRHEEASAALQRGFFLATQLGNNELALIAAIWLAELEGVKRQRLEIADLWVAQAEALLAREPRRYPDLASDLADTSSWNAYLRGDLIGARAEAERGIEILDQAQLDAPIRRLALLLDRGAAEYGVGDLPEAAASFRAALEIAEATVGRDNAKATGALNNLAFTYMAEGELEQARELLEESVAIRERALGPNNAVVGSALSNLAELLIEFGEAEAALAAAERAHTILSATQGPEQYATVIARQRFGLALALVGRYDEALAELRAVRTLAQAPPDPSEGLAVELSAQLVAVGFAAGARQSAAQDLALVLAADPSTWPDLAAGGRFSAVLGRSLDHDDATELLLRRAIDLADRPSDAHGRRLLGQTKLILAELTLANDPAGASALLSGDIEADFHGAPIFAAKLTHLRNAAEQRARELAAVDAVGELGPIGP